MAKRAPQAKIAAHLDRDRPHLHKPFVDALHDVPGTKLLVPRIPDVFVHRSRLYDRLESGVTGALTVVSAPPGSGKTTAVVDWLQTRPGKRRRSRSVAWVTLDASDNDPARFIRVLVASLRTIVPTIGEASLAMVRESTPSSGRAVLTGLVNELAAAAHEVILVLENYHAIREPIVHEIVEFLIERRPQRVHVVITTREDPPFRLSDLRARGVLCELRTADLRFTSPEGAEFLRTVSGKSVSADEAATLHAHTDGWAAALQLAGVSMRSGTAVSGFLAGLESSRHHILEYLGEEVLARQSPAVQTFLLRTAVLDRMSASLCNAVLADEKPEIGAQAMLELLERTNLFLTPLDAERRWFAYHQLFAEFLRAELERATPDIVPEIHRRASQWCDEHGLVNDAIRYALAVPDVNGAARLIERHAMTAVHYGEQQKVLGWFRALPEELLQARPRLCVIRAWSLCFGNELDAAERYLQLAEQWDHSTLAPDDAAFVAGRALLLRSILAKIGDEPARSIRLAGEALTRVPSSDLPGRALAGFMAQQVTGDVRPAKERAFVAAVEETRAAGLPVLSRIALARLAQLYALQGRLRRAATTYEEALRVLSLDVLTGVPTYCFGRGDLLREWNELDEAERLLTQGTAVIVETNVVTPHVIVDGYIALARLWQARGNDRAALAAIHDVAALARQRSFPEEGIARAAAARAQLWLTQGNFAAATRWADGSGCAFDGAFDYFRELEYLVFARIRVAQKQRRALELLDRLLAEAEAVGRMGSAVQILAFRAVAHQAFGDRTTALADLERLLALTESEGYVRVFVDEGPPMAALLRGAYAHGMLPEYVAQLLGAFGRTAADPRQVESDHPPVGHAASTRQEPLEALVETLTERERAILRLVVAGASNQEIASELFLATGTVKWHIHHIFGKFGVKSRTQAIARARALDLR